MEPIGAPMVEAAGGGGCDSDGVVTLVPVRDVRSPGSLHVEGVLHGIIIWSVGDGT